MSWGVGIRKSPELEYGAEISGLLANEDSPRVANPFFVFRIERVYMTATVIMVFALRRRRSVHAKNKYLFSGSFRLVNFTLQFC